MNATWIRSRKLRTLAPLGGLIALLSVGLVLADPRDGPIFGPPGVTITNSRRDFTNIYVFQSPTNPKNTVFVLDVAPFSTATVPNTFDQTMTLDLHIINKDLVAAASDDVLFRISFSAPDAMGVQSVLLQGFPAKKFSTPPSLASGKTGQNIPVRGGGMFRAAEQDDPFFFDQTGFNGFVNGGAFPRPVGTAVNFYGQDAGSGTNTLSCILEIPSSRLTRAGSNLIGVWVAVNVKGVQVDRMGRPLINTTLIPPVPRGSNFPIGATTDRNRQERRSAFNEGNPKNDRRDFMTDMVSVLRNFYGRSVADSNAIAGLLLPDILIFDVTKPDGFGTFLIGPGGQTFLGNGRRLRDDVIDFELTVLSTAPSRPTTSATTTSQPPRWVSRPSFPTSRTSGRATPTPAASPAVTPRRNRCRRCGDLPPYFERK